MVEMKRKLPKKDADGNEYEYKEFPPIDAREVVNDGWEPVVASEKPKAAPASEKEVKAALQGSPRNARGGDQSKSKDEVKKEDTTPATDEKSGGIAGV